MLEQMNKKNMQLFKKLRVQYLKKETLNMLYRKYLHMLAYLATRQQTVQQKQQRTWNQEPRNSRTEDSFLPLPFLFKRT